jgi:hypothetical protein
MSANFHFPAFGHRNLTLLSVVALGLFFTACGDKKQDETAAPSDTAPNKSITFGPGNKFEGIVVFANADITTTADGLKIHALSDDPSLRLPLIDVPPGTKLTLHAKIFSPAATTLQFFYTTVKSPQFDELHSIRKPIQKGDNDVTVEIIAPDFSGSIRLDPGELPGDYLVTLIEVQGHR